MRTSQKVVIAVAVALLGVGTLSAQPGSPPAPAPTPVPDVTASGETRANLSPREMVTETKKLLGEMEGFHVRVLALQGAARKSKDVIKLNCVNEKLLAVKQLLNIADQAQNDLTEAIAGSDRDAQVHQYSQVRLAHERATAERDEAEGCIGEEIVFIGPTQLDVDGPAMPDDPTNDPIDPFSPVPADSFEQVNTASPWF
jgi:hypothetical protein